ncbi:hypothetical protein [uncultured Dysgonomonas sp.]|uniref:Uncharacterized protein n=1 Tax=uncultured Dysgonomonas sp. TaxID=206096 RepID=A0A212IYC7_9BACT|nr:hypothetical protein [uncultured Dysgonomonas sp.]SBV91945.1 hypothetical protein KL86DYS1_10476 [uncultured Dysgonomonas sp.]
MEKEKLSDELKGLVGENSLSERTWNDYIDNSVVPFLPIEEDKISDYLAKHATSLKSLNGQLNYDVAGRVNEFKKTYKPETPVNPQPPKPVETKAEPQPDDMPEWAKSLLGKVDKIEQEKSNEAKTAKLDKTLSDAKSAIQKDGADNEKILKITFGLLKVDADEPLDSVVKKAKELYNETLSDVYGEGYNPAFGAHNSSAPISVSPDVKRRKELMAEERKRMRV